MRTTVTTATGSAACIEHQHGGNSHRRHATWQPKHPAARYFPFAGPRIWAYQLRLARNGDTHTAGKQALVAEGLPHPACAQHTSMHASTHSCCTVHRIRCTTNSMLDMATQACTHASMHSTSSRQVRPRKSVHDAARCQLWQLPNSLLTTHCGSLLYCSSCINMLSHPATSHSSHSEHGGRHHSLASLGADAHTAVTTFALHDHLQLHNTVLQAARQIHPSCCADRASD